MSAMRKGRGSTSFQGKQSDNDFQRHNADRHYREGSGQDRLQQQLAHKDRPEALYTVAGQMTRREGSYYLLRSVGWNGPQSEKWVNVKELIQVGQYVRVI